MTTQSQNWRIRFMVFVSGAVVMSVELMASRLFAPTFGNSIFVWGSLIGVIMIALSIGYWYGGKQADTNPYFHVLSSIILLSGIFVILIPITAPFVLELVQFLKLGEMYGPLLAAMLLLVIPTALLGMVSPYSIRLVTEDVVKLGSISGSLSSINTAGSIFGTFFTVFVLIPNFGTREILTSLGVVLVVVSLIGRTWKDGVFVFLLVTLLLVPEVFVAGKLRVLGGRVIYRKETPYSTLTVIEKKGPGTLTLFLDDLSHSSMYLNGSNKAVFRYTDYFNIAFAYNPNITEVLFIGGGGFSGPKQFLERYPWVNVDVVEIDPDVVDAAYRFFNVPKDDPRLDVYVMDGRAFLDDAPSYDLIVLDAYSPTYVPFHLMTLEFHSELNEHLNADGVIVSNLITSLVGDTSELLWSEVKTVEQVFPNVYLFPTKNILSSLVQNLIMVVHENQDIISEEEASGNIMQVLPDNSQVMRYYDNLYTGEPAVEGIILVDNFAPVDTLLNPVTKTSYERSGRLNESSFMSQYLLAGLWIISLGAIYFIINSWNRRHQTSSM